MMRSAFVRLALALTCALAATPAVSRAQAAGGPGRMQAGTVVAPDTVRIADPFFVRVRVRAPAGSRIEFPEPPDSTSKVQPLDPVKIETASGSDAMEQTATYRVAAWDIGDQPIVLGDVVVATPDGERRVPLGGLAVHVRSVLPADSAQRVPKPARDPFAFAKPMWPYWLAAAIASIALGLLVWWWWRRRRNRPRVERRIDPFQRAEHEFLRIEALGLLEAGERGRFVALAVEVLRDYLAARYPRAGLALTTRELLGATRGERALPADRLARLLDEADLVKFARRTVTHERARELAREARAIVAYEHRASTPQPDAATEAAA